jgi:erythromycin esterase-like protein
MTDPDLADVRALARPLTGDADLDALLDRVGEARLVLLGASAYGTAEFAAWRERLTRRLVAEKGFTFVAVEQHEAATGAPASVAVHVLDGDDRAMADALDRLLAAPGARGVVWAHDAHVGDARAADAPGGGVSLGQLARERHGDEGVVLVGTAAHRGSAVAAVSAQEAARGGEHPMALPPGRPGSAEELLHSALGDAPALLVFPQPFDQPRWLRTTVDHREVGAVHDPDRERWSGYIPATLGDCYDALLWVGTTTARS